MDEARLLEIEEWHRIGQRYLPNFHDKVGELLVALRKAWHDRDENKRQWDFSIDYQRTQGEVIQRLNKQITLMRDAAEAVLRGDDPYGAICAIRYVDVTYVPTEEERKQLEPIIQAIDREIEIRKTTPVRRVVMNLSDLQRLENERNALREAAERYWSLFPNDPGATTEEGRALRRALDALHDPAPKKDPPDHER